MHSKRQKLLPIFLPHIFSLPKREAESANKIQQNLVTLSVFGQMYSRQGSQIANILLMTGQTHLHEIASFMKLVQKRCKNSYNGRSKDGVFL